MLAGFTCQSGLWSTTACSWWFSLCSLFIHPLRFVIAQDLEKETATSRFQRQGDGEDRGRGTLTSQDFVISIIQSAIFFVNKNTFNTNLVEA